MELFENVFPVSCSRPVREHPPPYMLVTRNALLRDSPMTMVVRASGKHENSHDYQKLQAQETLQFSSKK
jgi:hypothetical protein